MYSLEEIGIQYEKTFGKYINFLKYIIKKDISMERKARGRRKKTLLHFLEIVEKYGRSMLSVQKKFFIVGTKRVVHILKSSRIFKIPWVWSKNDMYDYSILENLVTNS